MANEPGGTKLAQLITEIDLDRSKYDKKLDESVEAANLATIKIEKAFKQLGVRTDQSYEQQRVAITTFYKKIIDDANASANERAAAEQMLARKIEAINNKQYSALNSMRQAQAKAEEDSLKQRDQLWTNMGVRSNAQIELQRKQVMDSYNQLKSGAQSNHVELIRLEAAKNEKLARLDDEMFGRKRMTLASLQRDILRTYASFYIFSSGIQYLSTEFVGASLKMERINSTLNTITGSIYGTTEAMGYIRKESKRLGLDMETAALAYSKFAVSARGTALEGEGARKVFTGVSEAVAAMKLPASEADGIFLALSQMMSKGVISQEEMRQQLGERLPGAFQMAAKAMGVTTSELNKMVAAGKVLPDDLLPKLAEEFHKTYGKAAVEAANLGQAAINKYNNAIFESKAAIGEVIMTTMIPALALWAEGVDNLTKKWKAFINPTDTDVLKKQAEALQTQITGIENWQKTILSDKSGEAEEQLARLRKELTLINATLGIDAKGGFNAPKPPTPKPGPTQAELNAIKKAEEDQKKALEYRQQKELEWVQYSEKMREEYWVGVGKDYDENQKKEIKSSEDTAKYIADQDQKWLEYEQKMQDEYYEGIAKDVEKRGDLERKLYTDLRKSKESYYDASIELIRNGEAEFRAAGINESLIASWVASQTSLASKKSLSDRISAYDSAAGYEKQSYDLRLLQIADEAERIEDLTKDEAVARRYAANESDKAFIKMTRGSENFFQGTRAAFITLQEDAIRWGQVGTAVGSTFKTSLGTVMGDAIYQIIKGGFNENSLTLYAAQVGDNVLKSFTNKIGEMGSNYVTDLLKPGWDLFGNSLSSVWDLITGSYQGVAAECGQVGIIDYLRPAWNAVSDMFSNSSGSGIWDSIVSGFGSAMTLIMSYWDELAVYLAALFDSDTGSGIFGWLSSLLGYREGTFDMPIDPGHMFSSVHGPDGFAVVAHQGEMIIPAQESEAIRTLLSQMGYGANFDSIVSALDTQAMRDSFYEGTVANWAKGAIPNIFKGIMTGDIGSVLSGALNPALIFSSMFSGGFTQIAKDIFGIDPATANAGSFLGMGASALLGLGSLGAGILVPASIFGAQYIMDLLNLESDSANRDTLRDMYGTIGGNIAYARYKDDPTDQLEIVSQAAYAYREEPWGQNLDAAFGLYHSAESSWPAYQEGMAWQRAGMATRADFFKNTDAGKFIYGYYYRPELRDNFSPAQWEQMIAEGMGQYGMAYQNPMMWKPEFTFPQYVSASTDSYLAGQDADYTAFYGEDPTFTIDPSTWLYDGSAMGMHQIPPYVSSSDYWASVLPPNYYGTGIMPTITIDPGDFYTPPSYGDLGGMRNGGVASGPNSGYPMTLHGTEAVVPLPNGRSIPVEMNTNSQRPIIHTHVYLDRKQIALAVGDELDTNPRLKARYN